MNSKFAFHFLCISVMSSSALMSFADETIPLESDAVDKDYAQELPRIPSTGPRDALSTFQVAAGFDFKLELVAHEPLISDPISVAFDELGRMFVVCMRGYSEHATDHLGVVRMLEDTDGDGVYDDGTDYATGLAWPTAVACYDGGIFVAAAPHVYYFKDTDGDGKADQQETVMTGFSTKNVQGLLNSFRWGTDNRLYGAAGLNGGDIEVLGEKPASHVLRRRDFAFSPKKRLLQAVSGGAQHGATFDKWGERFVCSNSDHFQWIEYEDHHLQRNSQLVGYRARRSIATDGPAAEVYRSSSVEPWRIVRTRLRVKGLVRGPVEGGGRASGYFTSASGITVYQGDAFGGDFDDQDFAFLGDVGSNLIHLKRIESNGLSKQAVRATPAGTEFVTSTDNWFRPVQFANAPDGTLYVIDMYREVIEHPLSLPPMIKGHLDLNSGRDRGRIYRIAPLDWRPRSRLLPGESSNQELVTMLGHTNGWHRETAARLIVTRAAASREYKDDLAVRLESACRVSARPLCRTRALYCLQSMNRLAEPTLLAGLTDAHPQVRRHALKIMETGVSIGEALVEQLGEMVNDPDPSVRYQLALCIGVLDAKIRRPLLVEIARQNTLDEKFRFAILSSMAGDRIETLRALSEFGTEVNRELLSDIVDQLLPNEAEYSEAIRLLRSWDNQLSRDLMAQLMINSRLRGKQLIRHLEHAGVRQAQRLVEDYLVAARKTVADSQASIETRALAIKSLCLSDFSDVESTLASLLSPDQPAVLRSTALGEVGKYKTDSAGQLLISATDFLTPQDRRSAFDMLVSRTTWAKALLDRVQQDEGMRNRISAQHRQTLQRHPDAAVAKQAKAFWGTSSHEDFAQLTAEIIQLHGNIARGQKLFENKCSACHRLDDKGTHVGPDLQPLRKRGANFMLTNILEPNREVDSRYEAYTILTGDGQAFTGILANETDATIELQLNDGKSVRIKRASIEAFQATGRSLMPDGFGRELKRQEVADLVAYLVNYSQ